MCGRSEREGGGRGKRDETRSKKKTGKRSRRDTVERRESTSGSSDRPGGVKAQEEEEGEAEENDDNEPWIDGNNKFSQLCLVGC